MIKEGCDSGLKVFDFGRTRKDSGVYSFKKGWGGEEVPMTYYYKFYKRELKERQEIRYRGISKLWSKLMPNFLAKKLGPWLIKQIG
jgi:lipid II:glycine glycyltransferase (peptidoglycan interpeptide bridge formation enzyme)